MARTAYWSECTQHAWRHGASLLALTDIHPNGIQVVAGASKKAGDTSTALHREGERTPSAVGGAIWSVRALEGDNLE